MSRRAEPTPSPFRRLLRLGVALLGADLGGRLGSRTRVQVGPAIAEARLVPDPKAGTDVNVPPIGTARLETHKGLLRLEATVTGIDEREARSLVSEPGRFHVNVQRELKSGLIEVAKRSAAGTVAGAALASALAERSVKQTVAGGLVGAAAFAANAAVTYRTAKLNAWQNPHLSGLLAHAPGVIGDVRQIPKQFGRYRTQLAEITASVTGIYRGLTTLPGSPPKDAIRIVWLSDIHNNPLAFAVAHSLVEHYEAAMVIDTGDIADWGSEQETRVFSDIKHIPAPYLYIKGNHDGPQTVKALRKIKNVVVLDKGEVIEQAGLRIAGDADPRFTPDKSTGDDAFGKDRLAEIGTALAATLADAEVDIALVHDPVVAAQLAGVVPLVLSGHTHKRNDRAVDGTLLLTQGSSGGAGLRGVRENPPDPLAVSVLHIDPATKRLHTLDELTFGGLGLTELSLVRRAADSLGVPRAERAK